MKRNEKFQKIYLLFPQRGFFSFPGKPQWKFQIILTPLPLPQVPFVVAYIRDRKNFWLSLSSNSTEIFVLSPHLCIRI